MKLIREELGEDNVQSEIEDFKEKAEKLRAPQKEVKGRFVMKFAVFRM
mgnify:CR=1 FL=1